MSLSSIHFLVFTLLVLISYYLIPQKHRWIVLLCASFGYYIILCYKYIIFILTTIISTFGGGIWLYNVICHSKQTLKENKSKWSAEERKAFKQRAETKKKLVVAVILLFNFGILGFLKYFNFLANSVSGLLNILGIPLEAPQLGLILPLGISFYTFQSMGYIIDI